MCKESRRYACVFSTFRFDNILRFIRKHRFQGILRLLLRKTGDRIRKYVFRFTKEVLMEFSLADQIRDRKAPPGIEIRAGDRADLEEIDRISRDHEWIASLEELQEWHSKGYPVFLAYDRKKGLIAGYTSVVLGPEYVNAGYVKKLGIGALDAWVWDSFMRPEYRGGPIYWALLTEMLKWLKAEGFSRVFGTAELGNRRARVANRRVGARETCILERIDLFRHTVFTRLTPLDQDLLFVHGKESRSASSAASPDRAD